MAFGGLWGPGPKGKEKILIDTGGYNAELVHFGSVRFPRIAVPVPCSGLSASSLLPRLPAGRPGAPTDAEQFRGT